MMPNDATLKTLLQTCKRIAIVGLSDKPERPSYRVAAYLQAAGYTIYPVNPAINSVLGQKAYANLSDIPDPIDMVDVFRKSDEVPQILADTLAIGASVLWLQEGVVHEAAAAQGQAAGLTVIMDRCTKKEHQRLKVSNCSE